MNNLKMGIGVAAVILGLFLLYMSFSVPCDGDYGMEAQGQSVLSMGDDMEGVLCRTTNFNTLAMMIAGVALIFVGIPVTVKSFVGEK